MDAEAKRIMALSISKLYSSRTQRGGLRLHRSLLLSVTMRAARDIYHAAVLLPEPEDEQVVPCAGNESPDSKEHLEEDKENRGSKSRKRSIRTEVEPDFLPPKKERMEADEEVLKESNGCRHTEARTAFPTNRAVVAC